MKTTSTRPASKTKPSPSAFTQGHEAVQRFALPNDPIQTAVPHDAIPQNDHTHGRGIAPIQMARIPVGFDRVGVATNAADSLVTSGLANCIAIAVQDARTGFAVMGHYHTRHCFDSKMNVIEGNLVAFRTLLLDELERVAGAAPNPRFQIAVGALWLSHKTVDLDAASEETRFSLLKSCVSLFGTEPCVGGSTAEFFLGTGEIKGSGFYSEAPTSPIQPSNAPNAAHAGDNIPYDRLERQNVRGHKLDKNLTIMDKLLL